MDVALIAARLVLAAVFGVAGTAKLADPAGSRQAVIDFGAPRRLAPVLGVALPLGELAIAAALIPTATAWWGAVGALALLLLFIAAIGANVARGRRPDCHCFGQLRSSPAGWPTLLRNGLLAALAGFLVWEARRDAGLSAVGWLDELTVAQLAGIIGGAVLLALSAVEAVLLVNLVRQNGRLLLRLDAMEASLAAAGIGPTPPGSSEPEAGLPLGAEAPGFHLSGLHGETLTLDALRAVGKPVLLIFTDPDCVPCATLLPEIGAWQRDYSPVLMISVISRGTVDANRAKSTEHGLFNVLLQQDREVADAFEAAGTPSAVIVNPDGTIGSSVAAGPEGIRALVARQVGTPPPASIPPAAPSLPATAGNGSGDLAAVVPPRPARKIGTRAPRLKLPDLSGRTVNLAGMRGNKTLVLFWDPACGFCSQMLDDLKAWETDPPEGAPKLLVVSTGTVEANREMGLRSSVVLDTGFKSGNAFGAAGTPSAVLVDEEGRIASEVAVGAEQVLSLAGAQRESSPEATAPERRRIGETAPAFELPDLAGNPVGLGDFRGSATLVLFWNPGCGFCQQMLDDLKAWEADRPEEAPKLLVVSTGSVEANEALALRSPVLLNQDFSVASTFGASGTPMALLVDEEGRIASEVAAGAQAVLALARAGTQESQTGV